MANVLGDLELNGMEALMNKLEDLGKKSIAIQKEALEKGAVPIENEAKANSAWKDVSGNLRPTISKSQVKIKKGSRYIYVGAGGGQKELEYAWMLEYGTSKMRARPYLNPALAAKKDEARNIIKAEIKRELGL